MFRIIYSESRHGTTYLCKLLGSKTDSISFFEGSNKKNGLFYCKEHLLYPKFDFPSFINQKIEAHPFAQKPKKYLKILKKHEPYFRLLLKHHLIDGIIFLKRDTKDSYSSLVKALSKGDWSANPDVRMNNQNKGISGYTNLQSIPNEVNYNRQLKNWFKKGYQAPEQHGIIHGTLTFDELISESFNSEKFIESIFYDPS